MTSYKKNIKQILKSLATILFATYFFFGVFLFFFQGKIMYSPGGQSFDYCLEFSEAEKVNHNGTRFYYYDQSDKLVIYYHGNAGTACDRSFIKDYFRGEGYSYIFVEYAGYAGEETEPSKNLILKDAENIADYLKENKYRQIVVAGRSIGTAPALYQGALTGVDSAVLITPFDTMKNVARYHYSMYPSFLTRENYNNIENLENIENLLVIHGDKDRIVPIHLGKNLFESADAQNKKFIEIRDGNHNDVMTKIESYMALKEFLDNLK